MQGTVYLYLFRNVMGYTQQKTNIRILRPGDPMFQIVGNMSIANRAGFEISDGCPNEYVGMLRRAINNGWIKPVAFIRDDELVWDKLKG